MSVAVLTFGCRLNAYESEVIRREATAAGIDNAVVVNTCAVTAEAVRQAKQAIRRVKREGPDIRVVVTGCAAQTEAAAFAAMPEVDRVIGVVAIRGVFKGPGGPLDSDSRDLPRRTIEYGWPEIQTLRRIDRTRNEPTDGCSRSDRAASRWPAC